jgi:predicted phosphate transport protein (TIGR00153 family)
LPLFGKDLTFYDLLEAQATAASRAAQAFLTLTEDFDHISQNAQAIKEIEHEADQLVHKLFNRVDSTFITPLDKEDLHALSAGLDDITDAVEAAASRFPLYRLDAIRPDMKPIANLLVEITQTIYEAVASLRNMHNREIIQHTLARVHEIESQGDQEFRHALAELFNSPAPDPLMVIKWKDIYERTEKAMDRCERASNVIEGIMVKYA